jgi:predicted signal transduction protein with EAL and GGDEF domain
MRIKKRPATETMVMYEIVPAVEATYGLGAIGVQLAIDSFGTGYSSLAYLKRLPVDVLHVDRSFVHDVTTDADGAAVILAMLAMARSWVRWLCLQESRPRSNWSFCVSTAATWCKAF